MPIHLSPLEHWFTTHPGPYTHSLAPTAATPPSWRELKTYLPPGEFAQTFGYSESAGDLELRSWIAGSAGVGVEQISLSCGAIEANWLALAATIERGCRVICQRPVYPQLACVAQALGAELVFWDVGPDDSDEALELEVLRKLLQRPASLLMLNSPHNPSGRVFSSHALLEISRLIETQPQAYWLVDEVYRGVGAHALPPSACTFSKRAIISNSVSKSWALPGLRVGWLIGPQEIIQKAVHWREHTALALASSSEALVKALWPAREALIANNQCLISRNQEHMRRWLQKHPFLQGTVNGAAAALLVHPEGLEDDQTLAETLYRQFQVFVLPGSTLGVPGTLRIGFGHRDERALLDALAFLGAHLKIGAGA